MRIYWWQGGIFLNPESEEEYRALHVLTENLRFTTLSEEAAEEVARVGGVLRFEFDDDEFKDCSSLDEILEKRKNL